MKLPASVRQLLTLFRTVSLRQLMVNRFVIVVVVIVVATAGVQGYAGMVNDGRVTGHVVDGNGDPVGNATVTIHRVNIRSQTGSISTTTNEDGYYKFTNQTDLLEFRIQANKSGTGTSQAERHHLYFRGQNTAINLTVGGQNG